MKNPRIGDCGNLIPLQQERLFSVRFQFHDATSIYIYILSKDSIKKRYASNLFTYKQKNNGLTDKILPADRYDYICKKESIHRYIRAAQQSTHEKGDMPKQL